MGWSQLAGGLGSLNAKCHYEYQEMCVCMCVCVCVCVGGGVYVCVTSPLCTPWIRHCQLHLKNQYVLLCVYMSVLSRVFHSALGLDI